MASKMTQIMEEDKSEDELLVCESCSIVVNLMLEPDYGPMLIADCDTCNVLCCRACLDTEKIGRCVLCVGQECYDTCQICGYEDDEDRRVGKCGGLCGRLICSENCCATDEVDVCGDLVSPCFWGNAIWCTDCWDKEVADLRREEEQRLGTSSEEIAAAKIEAAKKIQRAWRE